MAGNNFKNLAKPDDGLHESPTFMVIDKNRGILKPSWAFVDANKFIRPITQSTLNEGDVYFSCKSTIIELISFSEFHIFI